MHIGELFREVHLIYHHIENHRRGLGSWLIESFGSDQMCPPEERKHNVMVKTCSSDWNMFWHITKRLQY